MIGVCIMLSMGLMLLVGVTVMFETEYFWDYEDNSNVVTLNSTITGFGGVFLPVVVLIILVVAVVLMCTVRCAF